MTTKLRPQLRSLHLRSLFPGAKTLLCLVFVVATLKLSAQAPNISYGSTQNYLIGSAVSVAPVNSGGPVASAYTISAALPRGLSFDAATGIISGVPTLKNAGTKYQIMVSNAFGRDTTTFILSVVGQPIPAISYRGPQVYTVGTEITDLSPQNLGGPTQSVDTIASSLSAAVGIAVDAAGNVYVADRTKYHILEIPVSGAPFVKASGFAAPVGVAVDAAGNLYVADHGNGTVKEIPAGGGSMVDIASGFNAPYGIAVDDAGNVFVSDQGTGAVIKIPAGGGSQVTIGTGFKTPRGIKVDAAGNVYVADFGNSAVKEIPVGGGAIVTLNTSGVYAPTDIALDSKGNIYAGTEQSQIVMIPAGGGAGEATYHDSFFYPDGLAIGADGVLYTVNGYRGFAIAIYLPGGFTIRPTLPNGLTIDPGTGTISGTPTTPRPAVNYTITTGNSGGMATAVLNLAVNSPQAPVISYNSPQVYTAGTAISPLYPSSSGGAVPNFPQLSTVSTDDIDGSLAVDAAGDVYVSDGYALLEYKPGIYTGVILASGTKQFTGVAVDGTGNIYVASVSDKAVEELPAGSTTLVTVATGFNVPAGLAVDAAGNLYVTDTGDKTVKEIKAGTNVPITLAAGFNKPTGVAVDAMGNLYIADAGNSTVVELPAGGGTRISLGSGWQGPYGIAADKDGNLYVAESGADGGYFSLLPRNGQRSVLYGGNDDDPEYFTGVAVGTAGNIYISFEDDGVDRSFVERLTFGYSISPALPEGVYFDRNTGVITGTPLNASPATNYTITAINAQGTATAAVSIKVAEKASALAALTISAGTLSPLFTSDNSTYTVNETYADRSVTLTPTAIDTGYAITVNGTAVTTGKASQQILLSTGTNTINVAVSANDGSSTKTYTVTATLAPPSNNAGLANLQLSNGSLGPVFSPATSNYSTYVGNTLTTMTVTATAADPAATIKINGVAEPNGSPSGYLPLVVGPNIFTIVVTAQDSITTNSYTLIINKAHPSNSDLSEIVLSNGTLSPVFLPAITNYTAVVDNGVSSITITPVVSESGSVVAVNGSPVTSATASGSIPLTVGNNIITLQVTAQNGSKKAYTVTVLRSSTVNVYLSSLTASNGVFIPQFSPGSTIYNTYVGNLLSTMQLMPTAEDPLATITINGSPVTSGSPSSFLPLAVGQNTFNVVVTGSDGNTKLAYTVIVNESKSENNYLFSLTTSSGFTQGLTVPETMSQNVRNETNSITVTPTVRDLTSTVTVNGSIVTSGSPSAAIALNVGNNAITIVVTAEDQTTRAYTLTVTRAADATLSNLQISNGNLNTPFSPDRTMYSTIVGYGAQFSITPTAEDPGATIKVNGATVSSGAAYPVALTYGHNSISIVVTGSDGIATHTYTLLVSEARSGNPYLYSLKTSTGIAKGRTVPQVLSQTVPHFVNEINITPTAVDAPTVITVNGTTVASDSTSALIPLTAGDTTNIIINTTAQTGASATYTVKIFRLPPSSNNSVYQPVGTTKRNNVGVQKFKPLLADDGINVHQGVSPNGDGINDFLQIDNISNYPDNKLSIMNRNGELIFEAKGYDNATKTFDGHSNKTGQMQLPGTYFYQLDYTVNGIIKHKTGFLVLKY